MSMIEPGSVWRRISGAREQRYCKSCGRFCRDGYVCTEGSEKGAYLCLRDHLARTGPAPAVSNQQSAFSFDTDPALPEAER